MIGLLLWVHPKKRRLLDFYTDPICSKNMFEELNVFVFLPFFQSSCVRMVNWIIYSEGMTALSQYIMIS